MSGVYCLLASALIVLILIVWSTYEIPFSINVFLAALGVVATVLEPEQLISHLLGAVCISGVLGVIYLISGGRAIGGGDIKLMAACGLLLGWQRIVLAFFVGCILGSMIHLIRIRVSHVGHVLAMGPYLAAGIFLSALWGNGWIAWYLGLLGL